MRTINKFQDYNYVWRSGEDRRNGAGYIMGLTKSGIIFLKICKTKMTIF